ncbi:MAG TPA: hypothetical protein VGO59_05930 [Verrucomicrobiae bacterium]|jgi:hypothetical protein
MKALRNIVCALILAALAASLTGCATDSDVSTLPWDQPAGWEGPFPSTINQGR